MEKELQSCAFEGGINAATNWALAPTQKKDKQKPRRGSSAMQDVIQDAGGQLLIHGSKRPRTSDVSEGLFDVDDVEVNGYLNNKKEMLFKKIAWELMNKEYLKGRGKKQARRAKNDASTKRTVQTSNKVEDTKRLSSKINYDALKRMTDGQEGLLKKSKEEDGDSVRGNLHDTEQFNENSMIKEHSFGEGDDYCNEESENQNGYQQESDASGDHSYDLYSGNEN